MAKEQPGESQRYGGLENTTTFGVAAKRARDNDEQLHTNQVLYVPLRERFPTSPAIPGSSGTSAGFCS